LCEVENNYGKNPQAEIFYNRRIIACKTIQKAFAANSIQKISIKNMINPAWSGIMQGFMVEIMDGDSSIVK
jgi:hypothetical protein